MKTDIGCGEIEVGRKGVLLSGKIGKVQVGIVKPMLNLVRVKSMAVVNTMLLEVWHKYSLFQ